MKFSKKKIIVFSDGSTLYNLNYEFKIDKAKKQLFTSDSIQVSKNSKKKLKISKSSSLYLYKKKYL